MINWNFFCSLKALVANHILQAQKTIVVSFRLQKRKKNQIRNFFRCSFNTLAAMNSSQRPPPIPPSRRYSQQLQQQLQQQQQQLQHKNSPNSVQYPPISSSYQQQQPLPQRQVSSSSVSSSISSSSAIGHAGGMRQSITFHGQLNRHTTNANSSNSNSFSGNSNSKHLNDSNTLTRRNKPDRPVSFAYGTLPDQNYLENQLRIYSEQLRSITESVRKYSEQAKILSEMKRQQQQMHQHHQKGRPFDLSSPQKTMTAASQVAATQADDIAASSKNLRLFLDSVRSTMNEIERDTEPPPPAPISSSTSSINQTAHQQQQQQHSQRPFPKTKSESGGISAKTVTEAAKTPSDQLRQFLDAIRSNQLPDENESDLTTAADRFSKFKEKMEHSRSKSTPNFNQYQLTSTNVNESFTKLSDNLRIMNEDLEALAAASPRKCIPKLRAGNVSGCGGGVGSGGTGNANAMDFNQILDRFSQMTNNVHSIESIDYLRKCSEALKHSTKQLKISTVNQSSFSDSADSSSCSTTPGSIREAVQNLLQQPRNGVQIMDDRMKLFIDILDTQSKFSQVKRNSIFNLNCVIFE